MTRAVVGVIDYQAGNIQSIENAFFHLGAKVIRVSMPDQLASCTHLVLPGVGAFGFCAEKLQASGLQVALKQRVFTTRQPLLGICVGMQLLSDASEESPDALGLGWCGGQVKRIPASAGIRVPHVGWNRVQFEKAFGEFEMGEASDFYFDHSFAYQQPREGEVIGYCMHGESFSAIIQRDNIIATQFHPEKSQEMGLRFLKGFLSLCA